MKVYDLFGFLVAQLLVQIIVEVAASLILELIERFKRNH